MRGFEKLFWGFLFMFDFRIQGFDVLPDIVGYLFFFSGLGALINESNYFQGARKAALFLAFFSILDLYQKQTTGNQFAAQPLTAFSFFIGVILIIVHLYMVHQIVQGIIEMARDLEDTDLEEKANKRWRLYLWSQIGILFVIPLAFLVPILALLAIIAVMVLFIVAFIQMMILMKQADRTFGV